MTAPRPAAVSTKFFSNPEEASTFRICSALIPSDTQKPPKSPYSQHKMRPLTEQETKTLFEKLANYTGASLKNLIAPLDDSPNADRYVFRLQGNRVFYVLLSTANLATSMARDNLLSLGICLGTCILCYCHRKRILPFPHLVPLFLSPHQ